MIRLKARPARIRNQGIAFLANWLTQCDIDPAEPCRGSTAVQVLFGKLFATHGNTAVTISGKRLVAGTNTIINPDYAREYIWGTSTEIITVSDEEVEEMAKDPTEPLLETVTEPEEGEEDNASSR